MSTLNLVTSCFVIILQCFLLRSQYACANSFMYGDFKGSSIILLKDASIYSHRVLTLTNRTQRSMSRALYPNPIKIKANDGSVSPFSTTFIFAISPPSVGMHGHGLAFIIAPNKSIAGATDTQFLGLINPESNGLESNHFLAVEFDVFYDPDLGDIDDNHVGVNKNGVKSFASQPAAYWTEPGYFTNLSLKSGENFQAWIDYNNVQDQLDVSVAVAGMEKPLRPLISASNVNISSVLKEEVYLGFTASTGTYAVEGHYILGWSFSTEGKAPPLDLTDLPSFVKKKRMVKSRGFSVGVTVASLVLFLLLLVFALMKLREIKRRENIEEWELEFWPHRIPYEELLSATQNFSDTNLVGRGGFGRVYKGVLSRSGVEVAVKCIKKDSTVGMKEFISEISSVGRLQHRNLVQLRGWCRRNKELFIVYDYMPNGSLDKFIFPNPASKAEALSWERRYAILKGIAAGLLYLHEQWERRVVHRDVKSSNVLLDSELNAKLGDFGLARLYDHTQNPQTTRVVGTVGYIDPEVTKTGKVTPSSDVFSFGIVLLEVACGRKPIDLSRENEQIVLLEWVRGLYHRGEILDAADPNLNGMFDVEEMELVLKLGLVCSHPQPEARLGITVVLQILEGQVPFPDHSILWVSYDMSYRGCDSGVVHITDEDRSADQLASIALSVKSATASAGHGYDKRFTQWSC